MDDFGLLKDNEIALVMVAVMVKRAGGDVTITQQEVDEIRGQILKEDLRTGSIRLFIDFKN